MDNYLGQVIGNRYEVQDIIGIGGMSVVYKAYDRVDDRVAAVKILKDEFLASEEFRLRFRNESKAIAVLSHPNIVKVYDVSFGETLQYIAMEYVEGITLKEYIERQGCLDIDEAVHFVVQILRALQHAHDKGIVHRDVKPQNIMLLPNATIKVADFGIARFSRAESRNLNETAAIGSVHYISPEQARGDYTDGRADIYSVGVVLYEMLTGKLPFESDNDISVALMQLQQEAIRPSELNPKIPRGLEQIVLRAMQKNPADRYQSAAEFLQDLDEFRRDPQIEFDYSYFTDKRPTRYLDSGAIAAAGGEKPVHILDDIEPDDSDTYYDFDPAPVPEPMPEEDDAPEEEDDAEDEARSRTIKIMIAVAAGFVAVVLLIFVLAFGRQFRDLLSGSNAQTETSQDGGFFSKLDIFGWFSKDKIEVPNFLNMEFEEALEKYPDLNIENPPQYVYNPSYEAGKIFEQTPDAGNKVPKDTVIRLTVANSSDNVRIKNVVGMNYLTAEAELKAAGFVVELVPTESEDVEQDLVISTKPSPDTFLENQGTVFVYYAVAVQKTDADVPNVIGDQLSVARQKISAAGLNVGSVTYGASSAALKDYVIQQDPVSGTELREGEYVNLVIGNGVPANATASFTIYLPDTNTDAVGTVKTYLNNNAYDIMSDVKLDGSPFSLNFTGTGADNTFKIYVDSTLIYSGKIDFTKEPPEISDLSSFTYSTKESMPDVVGFLQQDAETKLNEAGFTNVKIETAASDIYYAGVVISQSPVSSNLTQYLTTTVVTLTVSAGPGPQAVTEPLPSETGPSDFPVNEPVDGED